MTAGGRVDIPGELDQDLPIYLKTGVKGVSRDGWYWIEQKRLDKVRILDKRIVSWFDHKVSDYVDG